MELSFIPFSSCGNVGSRFPIHRTPISAAGKTFGGFFVRKNHRKPRLPSEAGQRWSAQLIDPPRVPETESTLQIPVSGLNCGSCVVRCERCLRDVFGEGSTVFADLLSSSVTVTANKSSTRILVLASAALKDSGFGVESSVASKRSPRSRVSASAIRRVTFFSVCVFLLSLAARRACCGPLELRVLQGTVPQMGCFLLSILYICFPLRKVFASGAASISQGTLPMNALILLSVVVQIFISGIGFLFPDACSPRCLETLLLLFFVDAGRLLDSALRMYASKSRDALLDLQPSVSTRMTGSGDEVVATEDLCTGDRIRVDSGERFPVDGVLYNLAPGEDRAADQSAVTGEVLLSRLRNGDCVWAGSVNLSEMAVFVMASSSAAESEVALSASSVAKALLQKSDTQRLADIAASYFGIFAVFVAVSASLFWYLGLGTPASAAAVGGPLAPLLIAASVLCSACPCGLALAIPLVSMVAITGAARQGILFQSGAALEAASSRIKLLVLDKTGTLTTGNLRVTDVVYYGISEGDVISLAASAESSSHHPIASAISRHAVSLKIPTMCSVARQVVGCGVSATLTFRNMTCNVLVGSHDWISEQHPATFAPALSTTTDAAQSHVYVFVLELGGVVGCISLSDELSASPGSITELRSVCGSPRVAVLSGGSQDGVDSVCRNLGLGSPNSTDLTIGNLKPREKLALAGSLVSARRGHELPHVVGVGDGVNDAVLLAACETSFAMGRLDYGCAPAAASVAHVVIPSGTFSLIAESFRIARAAKLTSILSLSWAAAYNVVALLRASGISGQFVPVHIAALSMAVSSSVSLTIPIVLALYLEGRRRRLQPQMADKFIKPNDTQLHN